MHGWIQFLHLLITEIIDTSPYRIAEYKDWVEKEKIGPLVRVKWNQNTPYNNMCNDNLVNTGF